MPTASSKRSPPRLDRIERIVGAPLRTGEGLAGEIRRRDPPSSAELLIARYRVIPYIDRGDLLTEALDWARSLDGPPARGRLYTAPGGFGKTRFAIELVLALEAEGWTATFLSSRNARNLAPARSTALCRRTRRSAA